MSEKSLLIDKSEIMRNYILTNMNEEIQEISLKTMKNIYCLI